VNSCTALFFCLARSRSAPLPGEPSIRRDFFFFLPDVAFFFPKLAISITLFFVSCWNRNAHNPTFMGFRVFPSLLRELFFFLFWRNPPFIESVKNNCNRFEMKLKWLASSPLPQQPTSSASLEGESTEEAERSRDIPPPPPTLPSSRWLSAHLLVGRLGRLFEQKIQWAAPPPFRQYCFPRSWGTPSTKQPRRLLLGCPSSWQGNPSSIHCENDGFSHNNSRFVPFFFSSLRVFPPFARRAGLCCYASFHPVFFNFSRREKLRRVFPPLGKYRVFPPPTRLTPFCP